MKERLAQVHYFWFGDYLSEAGVLAEKSKLWFGKRDKVDNEIRDRFGDLVEMAASGAIDNREFGPTANLCLILLLDQFPRNIFRNDPRSFASDPLALDLAKQLVGRGGDGLRPLEKVFLYLPFEHAENLDDQKRSLALFRKLLDAVGPDLQSAFAGFYDYAVRHHDIIARFGRFPHRNRILQRASTEEENSFLRLPGSSF